ncbi:hypothetical protein CSUI_008637, partial [Cystoisospora suis]
RGLVSGKQLCQEAHVSFHPPTGFPRGRDILSSRSREATVSGVRHISLGFYAQNRRRHAVTRFLASSSGP